LAHGFLQIDPPTKRPVRGQMTPRQGPSPRHRAAADSTRPMTNGRCICHHGLVSLAFEPPRASGWGIQPPSSHSRSLDTLVALCCVLESLIAFYLIFIKSQSLFSSLNGDTVLKSSLTSLPRSHARPASSHPFTSAVFDVLDHRHIDTLDDPFIPRWTRPPEWAP
jgi:hypothetical protein